MSYATGLPGFVKTSAYLLTNSHMGAVKASPASSKILESEESQFSWFLCYFTLKWARGLTSASNSEVSSVAVHCKFVHKAVLEGLHEAHRFA